MAAPKSFRADTAPAPRSFVSDEDAPPQEPQVGAGETFLNRAVNALPGGRAIVDALSAGALEIGSSGGTRATLTPQAQAELRAMGEEVPEERDLVDTYRDARDRRADRTEAGSRQNPWAGRAGALTGFGLSLVAPLPKAPGSGLGSTVATGAGHGAFAGLTDGAADLTRGELGQAAQDVLTGAALGGGLGAAGHGLMRAGQSGVRALRGARAETLAQEQALAREAAEAGQAQLSEEVAKHRELVGKARGMMGKDFAQREKVQGQALEMDKARGAKAARSEERARRVLEKARKRAEPPPDPNTVVLEGMSGKAHQAQQSRTDQALKYQREMGEPDVNTQVAGMRQDYINRMPEALSDPAAARRQYMEKYLRSRYPDDPERVARIMRERVGPGGDVLPRPVGGASPPQNELPLLPELPVSASPQPLSREVLTPLPKLAPGQRGVYEGRGPPPRLGEREPLRPAAAPAEPSMAAPRDLPVAPPPGPATVPGRQRQTPALPTQEPTLNQRPQVPISTPDVAPARAPADDIQDVTRLAGPEDMGALAAERAAAREAGAVGAVAHAGYEGVRSAQNVLGAALGGLRGITREALRDPAVKARALSMAKVHLLARIDPELFARVGGQLARAATAGDGQYRALRYVHARRDPAFRKAEEDAAAQVSMMGDDELMRLIAGPTAP